MQCVVVVGRLERVFGLHARQATGRMGRQTHAGDIPPGALLIGTDHKVSAMCHLMRDCKQGQSDEGSQLPVTGPECDQQGGTEETETGDKKIPWCVLTDGLPQLSHKGLQTV